MEEIKKDIKILKTDVTDLKSDVSLLKTDVAELKSDVGVLKEDVGTLKEDVNTLKTDVGALKEDVSVLKIDVGALSESLDSLAASTKNQFDEVRVEQRELAAKILEKIELMHDDMRDMKRVESSLIQSQAATDRITTDHEGRLTKIEGQLELV